MFIRDLTKILSESVIQGFARPRESDSTNLRKLFFAFGRARHRHFQKFFSLNPQNIGLDLLREVLPILKFWSRYEYDTKLFLVSDQFFRASRLVR